MTEQVRSYLLKALEAINVNHEYHQQSLTRYTKTILLANQYYEFDKNSSVAELGPGLLLPYAKLRYKCSSTGYGLMTKSWKQDLESLNINTSIWNFNTPLSNSEDKEQHDLLFFCEAIEHLNRWPIEVLQDVCTLVIQ